MGFVRLPFAPSTHLDWPVRPRSTSARTRGRLSQPNDQLLSGLVVVLLLVEFVVPRSDPLISALGTFAIYAAVLVAYPFGARFGTWASQAARMRRDVIGSTKS